MLKPTCTPVLPLFTCLAFALACNEVDLAALAGEPDAAPVAERPEGWESLEDAESASRLYYQFVDAKGRVRFVERMEDVPEQWRTNVGFVKMAVPPPLSPGDAARTRRSQAATRTSLVVAASKTPSEVILYSAVWCGACQKAKRYLSRNGIEYEERDVDTRGFADELVQKTGRRSIPVIDVDGRVFTGFDPGAYDDLISG